MKFDLNRDHWRFLLDFKKSEFDHTSERTRGGSVNGENVFLDENPPWILVGEFVSGVIRFKLLVNPSCDE